MACSGFSRLLVLSESMHEVRKRVPIPGRPAKFPLEKARTKRWHRSIAGSGWAGSAVTLAGMLAQGPKGDRVAGYCIVGRGAISFPRRSGSLIFWRALGIRMGSSWLSGDKIPALCCPRAGVPEFGVFTSDAKKSFVREHARQFSPMDPETSFVRAQCLSEEVAAQRTGGYFDPGPPFRKVAPGYKTDAGPVVLPSTIDRGRLAEGSWRPQLLAPSAYRFEA